jgi:hypothetical protein
MNPSSEPVVDEIRQELGRSSALPSPPLPLLDALLYAVAFAGFLALVALSAWLNPSSGGVGTHTQLHLPPCGVLLVFGKPCPSCGMTTAFAWMVRGRVLRALSIQPAGVAVFLAALAWWLYLPVGFFKRRPFFHIFDAPAFLPTVMGLVVIILAVWGLRLAGWY